jgi:hypothetical protein
MHHAKIIVLFDKDSGEAVEFMPEFTEMSASLRVPDFFVGNSRTIKPTGYDITLYSKRDKQKLFEARLTRFPGDPSMARTREFSNKILLKVKNDEWWSEKISWPVIDDCGRLMFSTYNVGEIIS